MKRSPRGHSPVDRAAVATKAVAEGVGHASPSPPKSRKKRKISTFLPFHSVSMIQLHPPKKRPKKKRPKGSPYRENCLSLKTHPGALQQLAWFTGPGNPCTTMWGVNFNPLLETLGSLGIRLKALISLIYSFLLFD